MLPVYRARKNDATIIYQLRTGMQVRPQPRWPRQRRLRAHRSRKALKADDDSAPARVDNSARRTPTGRSGTRAATLVAGTAQITVSASMGPSSMITPVATPFRTTTRGTGVETRMASPQASANQRAREGTRAGFRNVELIGLEQKVRKIDLHVGCPRAFDMTHRHFHKPVPMWSAGTRACQFFPNSHRRPLPLRPR